MSERGGVEYKGKEENHQVSMNRARKVAFSVFFRDGQSLLLFSIHLASWIALFHPLMMIKYSI